MSGLIAGMSVEAAQREMRTFAGVFVSLIILHGIYLRRKEQVPKFHEHLESPSNSQTGTVFV